MALRILKWIQRRGEETFTKHEVQRGVQPDRVSDLDQPLALLEEHGYIRRLPPRPRTGKVGRPVTDEWEVNPAILHDKNDGMQP